MKLTRRDISLGASAAALGASVLKGSSALAATRESAAALDAAVAPEDGPHEIVHLWRNDRPPGGLPQILPPEAVLERSAAPALRDRALVHTLRPRMVVFRPEHPNGAGLLMCPGGAFVRCALDKESYESAKRFNAAGITCFVLLYRFPGDHWAAGADVSLHDAQRAMRLIRARASDWSLDPARIGIVGFSAGGWVAAATALSSDAPRYPRTDAADGQSAKPAASILMYPVISMMAPYGDRNALMLLGEHAEESARRARSLELLARADAPATFIAAAADDDTVPVENSLMLAENLHEAHAPVELHVFETGGHGFGLRFTPGKPTAAWPELALMFLQRHGLAG
jgi:acetyl esterase/lipase